MRRAIRARRVQALAWLNSIARNRTIDLLRQKSFATPPVSEDGVDWYEKIAAPGDPEADFADIAALRRCLGAIEEPNRSCVLLAYYEGYSRDELAARFGKPVNTIKTWLHRSLLCPESLSGTDVMNEDREILAAEYVLGTLHADERTLFVSILAQDRRGAGRRRALGGAVRRAARRRRRGPAAAGPMGPHRRPAAASGAGAARDRGRGWSVERRRAAPLAHALAGRRQSPRARSRPGLAIFVVDRELIRHPTVQPAYVAVVNRGGDQPALIVRVDLAKGTVYVRPLAAEAPAGKSLELWYIGAGKPPKSMGVVGDAAVRMPLPAGLSPEKASLAVTVEPPGGSPTGDPTGPIVYSGQLIRE